MGVGLLKGQDRRRAPPLQDPDPALSSSAQRSASGEGLVGAPPSVSSAARAGWGCRSCHPVYVLRAACWPPGQICIGLGKGEGDDGVGCTAAAVAEKGGSGVCGVRF